MTRAELKKGAKTLRLLLEGPTLAEQETCIWGDVEKDAGEFLAILDADLAVPEAREWRVFYKIYAQSEEWESGPFSSEEKMRSAYESLGPVFMRRIESRVPAGEWQREKA